jgi:hypothetical protein
VIGRRQKQKKNRISKLTHSKNSFFMERKSLLLLISTKFLMGKQDSSLLVGISDYSQAKACGYRFLFLASCLLPLASELCEPDDLSSEALAQEEALA